MSISPDRPRAVPRPPAAVPGDPPPWAALDGSRRGAVTVERVTGALAGAGRGGDVPPGLGPPPSELRRHAGSLPVPPAPAAVLIALFDEAGEARVLLTRRSTSLRLHRGEVSFPGGRLDPGENVRSGALREAEEEIGLAPSLVHPVGWLDPVLTLGSNSVLTPVVARLRERPVLRPNPAEVDRVFDVELAHLMADGVCHQELWAPPGVAEPFPVWFFEADGEVVWGATARVLMNLLGLVIGGGNGGGNGGTPAPAAPLLRTAGGRGRPAPRR